MERTINMKLEERLEGAIGERGKFTGYTLNKKGLETKNVFLIKLLINVLYIFSIFYKSMIQYFRYILILEKIK